MEHLIYRCKNCCKTYVYCTYGNGEEFGTEEGCTREYCAECGNAISKALHDIPRKYMSIRQLVTDKTEFESLNNIFDRCKDKFYQENNLFSMTRLIPDLGYKSVEGCYIDRVECQRCIKENGEIDIYINREYDLVKDEYTGKNYFESDKPREQYFLLVQLKFPENLNYTEPCSESSNVEDILDWYLFFKSKNDNNESDRRN